jgi:hypothetical protein
MVQAEWSVQFSGDPATTLFQANAEWLDIIVPSDATSIQLYASALYDPPQEPAPELPPATRFSINFDNQCVDYVDSADVLIGVPRESDLFLAPGNRGSFPTGDVFDSDDPKLIFTSLTGRQMCAVVDRTGFRICGTDNVAVSDFGQDEFLRLECPDPVPPQPVADRTIDILIVTDETSPNLVVQIGCEQPGGPCFSYTAGNTAYHGFQYPMLDPMLRLRVRVFASIGNGQSLSHVEWSAMISFGLRGYFVPYVQRKGEWFDISVPSDATYIEIRGNGFENGSIPESGPYT